MNEELQTFIKRCLDTELKWMYHYDVDDHQFGIETDKYQWCKKLLDGRCNIETVIEYFEKYYPKDEVRFIEKLKELAA